MTQLADVQYYAFVYGGGWEVRFRGDAQEEGGGVCLPWKKLQRWAALWAFPFPVMLQSLAHTAGAPGY